MNNIKDNMVGLIKNLSLTSTKSELQLEGSYLVLKNFPISLLIPLLESYPNAQRDKLDNLPFDNYEDLTVKEFFNNYRDNKNYKTLREYKLNTALWDDKRHLFQIYQNTEDLISAFKRAFLQNPNSKLPEDFYLIDEDYIHLESEPSLTPNKIARILTLKTVFEALEQVADFQDNRNGTILYFKTSEKKGHICPIELNESMLFNQEITLDTSSLEAIKAFITEIKNLDSIESIANEEKKFIFSSSISEFLQNKENKLIELIHNWSHFKNIFDKNHQVYIQGKSINELKVALAEEQIKLSDNITKGIIDVLSKILVLPAASALFLIFRQSIQTSSHNLLITFIFGALIIIIALAIITTSYIHFQIIEALDFSSQFVKKDLKHDLIENEDQDFLELDGKLKEIIRNTKKILKIAIYGTIFFTLSAIIILFYLHEHSSKKTVPSNTEEKNITQEAPHTFHLNDKLNNISNEREALDNSDPATNKDKILT